MPNLTINGQSYFADAPPDTPLLWVIREDLRLTGTKYGCGSGLCGSCTVHIDGRAERSCLVTVDEVRGALITTIEGLDPANSHPVQRAWIEQQVPQCGYCQSGQIMQAAALLAANGDGAGGYQPCVTPSSPERRAAVSWCVPRRPPPEPS